MTRFSRSLQNGNYPIDLLITLEDDGGELVSETPIVGICYKRDRAAIKQHAHQLAGYMVPLTLLSPDGQVRTLFLKSSQKLQMKPLLTPAHFVMLCPDQVVLYDLVPSEAKPIRRTVLSSTVTINSPSGFVGHGAPILAAVSHQFARAMEVQRQLPPEVAAAWYQTFPQVRGFSHPRV